MIRKAILYFAVITILLYGLRTLHYQGLLKTKGYYEKYEEAFTGKTKFDVLFLGSSRAEMAYDTGLYDSLTGKRSFNLGTAGATPRLAYLLFTRFLETHPKPGLIYYEIDFHALKKAGTGIKDFNNFFPFLRIKELRSRLATIDPRMEHFYYDPYFSWPYTGLKNISTSLHGWFGIPNKSDKYYHNGFLKETTRPYSQPKEVHKTTIFFNPVERSYLDSVIFLSKQAGCELRLISSPACKGANETVLNKKELMTQFKNIAIINKVTWTDLSNPPFAGNERFFVDPYHLNYQGARQFTRLLVATEHNKTLPGALK